MIRLRGGERRHPSPPLTRIMRGKGEGAVYRVPKDPSKPLKYWTAAVELPNPTGRPQDRRRKVVRSKSKQVALAKLKELQEELRKKGDLRTSNVTTVEWFDYWMTAYAEPNLRPKAVESYRSTIKNRIIPSLGEKTRLDKITPAMVNRLRQDIVEAGLSPTYARNAHHILSRSLTDAAGEGRIPSNPCDFIKPPRKAVAKLDVLTLDEGIRLLGAIKHRPDAARWATSLLTGARRGEVIGLERDRVSDVIDLSWQLQRLTIVDGRPQVPADFEYRQVKGGLFLTRPKSRAGWRIVPLVDPLASILAKYMEDTPENEYGLMFLDDGGRPRDPDWDSKQWRALMREVFGECRFVRLHDVRHTTVDLLYLGGVPEDLISEIVGHSTRSMTRAYKSRSDIQRLRDAMSLFSSQFMLPEPEHRPEIGA